MEIIEKNRTNVVSIDRLGDLTDSLLCHILSFLPTKLSVATSVLGRRWRFLWAYVPTLDFHMENQDIINRVMLLRKMHNVDTFRLYVCECNEYQFETWVAAAVARNVRVLDLNYESNNIIPRCLLTCETLVDLRLTVGGVIPKNGAVCFPRLKKLYLFAVGYETNDSLTHLLSGCPVLEELVVNLRTLDDFLPNISSSTIKRLNIDMNFYCFEHDYRVEINAPGVSYLRVVELFPDYIKSMVLTSLIEADIAFCIYSADEDGGDVIVVHSQSALKFVDKLSSVKCLKLYLSNLDVIESGFSAWTPNFRNLTKLELTAECFLLVKLLENADNLKILIFCEGLDFEELEGGSGWMKPSQVPTCLVSHLTTITLLNMGTTNDLEIVKYLLSNAQVLDMMNIVYHPSLRSEEKIYLLQEISLFQRGSKACKVAFI